MDIAEIISYAGGEPSSLENLDYLWAESEASFPEDGIFFLRDEVWRRAFEYCDIPAEFEEKISTLVSMVKKDEKLQHMLWNVYWRQKGPDLKDKKAVGNWPEPVTLGELGHFFYLLPLFAIADAVIKQHRERSIPDKITRDTLTKVGEGITGTNMRDYGYPGIRSSRIGWFAFYRDEPYVKLGRLEFWVQKGFYYKCYAYRNAATGDTVVFPPDGTRFTMQGDTLENDPPEKMPFWTSRYNDDGNVVTGTPYSPRGYAVNRTISLDLREWKCIFEPENTYYAQLHIPAGGNMTPEACRESLAQVRPFFKKYYGIDVSSVMTTSWIFGSQLWQILPEKSNLLDFQRNIYCLPMGYNQPEIGMFFIFPSTKPFDWRTAPTDNNLRRSIVSYLRSGGQWKGGAMLYVLDDLDTYGSGIYRKRWDAGINSWVV